MYVCVYIYIYWDPKRMIQKKTTSIVWKLSSSSNCSIRAFRAYPLNDIRQAARLSSSSRQPYLSQQYPSPPS